MAGPWGRRESGEGGKVESLWGRKEGDGFVGKMMGLWGRRESGRSVARMGR